MSDPAATNPEASAPPRPGLAAVLGAMLFRWACFAVMTVFAVWNEGRPGTRLADPFLDLFPYSPFVARWNYELWIAGWLPFLLALVVIDRARFVRAMLAGGVLSLLRGVCVAVTGLGPVDGPDVNLVHDWDWDLRLRVAARILDFPAVFAEQTANVWLTKDLFFSGHTASTFLVVLAVWPYRRLRAAAITLHLLIVASLFFGRIHYTIDVLGAYAITWAVWRYGFGRGLDRARDAGFAAPR